MRFYHYEGAVITSDYGCAQSDAFDGQGRTVKGVLTVQLPDNHPDVLVYLANGPQPSVAAQKKNEELG